MSDSISDSLNKIRLIESQELAELAIPAAVKTAAKGLGRFAPGLGLAAGAYDAYGRAKQGDWTGAALSGLGGAASLIPGVGTAASIGIAGIQAGRDKARTGSWMPDDEEVAAAAARDQATTTTHPVATATSPATTPAQPTKQVPAGRNPKVLALQQQLIAKGAQIKADGIMGPQTQAAMKQFPDVQLASKINKNKGTIMSESEKIAALRSRLEQIDQPISEGPLGKAAWNLGQKAAGFVGGLGKGISNPKMTNLPSVAKSTAPAARGARTGAAIATNPGKVAAGAAAAGAAGGYFAGKPSSTPPVSGSAPGSASGKLTPAEVKELNQLAANLENSNDPTDVELMGQYNATINRIQK
jgi:peptidoglycan hydrolase-like protein with peptidoglycan-binding domain